MSECVESVHATDASPVKDSAKISEKVICEEDCVKSKKDENEVDGSQQVKRKSLDDGKREDEVTKKPKKDDAEDEAGDEEATSVNTDEEDGVEKETEGAEDVGEEEDSAGDEPAS